MAETNTIITVITAVIINIVSLIAVKSMIATAENLTLQEQVLLFLVPIIIVLGTIVYIVTLLKLSKSN